MQRGQTSQDEKRQRRREMVKRNVRALRQRRKDAAAAASAVVETAGAEKALEVVEAGDSITNCCQDNQLPQQVLQPGPNQMSLVCELRDNNLSWDLHLPCRLAASASSKDAFIAVFHHCCNSSQNPHQSRTGQVSISICCGSWVEFVCMQAALYDSSLISQALHAAALATIGWMRKDFNMLHLAKQAQSKVFAGIRLIMSAGGTRLDRERLHRTSVAMLTCAVTDLLVSKSWTIFRNLLKAVGALIEAAGPELIDAPETVLQFNGYRAAQVVFSFMERKTSFLSYSSWRGISTSVERGSLNIYKWRLLDIMYQVPMLMGLVDEFHLDHTETSSDDNSLECNDVGSIMTLIVKLENSLDIWEADVGRESLYSMLTGDYHMMDKPWEQIIDAADMTIAILHVLVAGTRVVMYETTLSLSVRSSHFMNANSQFSAQKYIDLTYQWAIIACQCLNWSIKQQANTMGKLYCLFGLDMTWKALKALHDNHGHLCIEELNWCENMAESLEQTGLPVLRRH